MIERILAKNRNLINSVIDGNIIISLSIILLIFDIIFNVFRYLIKL